VHLVAVSALAGIGWVVQCVVYPAFALVGASEWAAYHARHTRAITPVVGLPWAAQGISTVALLLAPGRLAADLGLSALALVTVVSTVAVAVPAHARLAAIDTRAVPGSESVLRVLLRANLVRTLAWSVAMATAGALVVAGP